MGHMRSHWPRKTELPAWRKASFCASGQCVEVSKQDDMILLRDSKKTGGRILRYTAEEWQSFVQGVKAGEFDDVGEPSAPKRCAIPAEIGAPIESIRDKSAPKNLLDLIDRVLMRATSSWRKCLMHLVLTTAFFGGLGAAAHAAAGVSPWVAAGGSLGGGVAAGSAAYVRRRSGGQVKRGERQLV